VHRGRTPTEKHAYCTHNSDVNAIELDVRYDSNGLDDCRCRHVIIATSVRGKLARSSAFTLPTTWSKNQAYRQDKLSTGPHFLSPQNQTYCMTESPHVVPNYLFTFRNSSSVSVHIFGGKDTEWCWSWYYLGVHSCRAVHSSCALNSLSPSAIRSTLIHRLLLKLISLIHMCVFEP
jgi:hypothetical protein